MGRAKIAMEFIVKEKTRNATYGKRKKGLLKKAHELSILCNVPVCIIIYPYKEGKQSSEAEVYAFKGDLITESNAMDLSRATDPMVAREMIDRYVRIPNEEKYKRALNLFDMFDEWTKKADQELSKLRHKNALVKYPCWDSRFDGLTLEQLMELLVHLDQKIEFVRQKISLFKSNNNHNHSHTHNHEGAALVPYLEPTPITSHQIGFPYVEGFNQLTSFNYPINNNNYNYQQFCHQLVPFNYPNLDNQGGGSSSSHQMGGTRMDDQGGSSSRGSSLMYNMNSMPGVVPVYYDQGRGFVDNFGATSSYGAGLTMSMPLQSMPMLPNASLQRQRQYHQMYYKQVCD
ncbi:floral homeotic protein GLOBOSA-like [Chenopodium quinoa]|uniref:floral homeotic protein GLOBOSA-like n=1 Tax=Chenopodium quinoa TaxID=63459 RepID=UPI000B7943C1|nr:floral homeotic protein GLOBOSA-like [Chenopodium quinoa]